MSFVPAIEEQLAIAVVKPVIEYRFCFWFFILISF